MGSVIDYIETGLITVYLFYNKRIIKLDVYKKCTLFYQRQRFAIFA